MNAAAWFVDLAAKSVAVLFAAWLLSRVFLKSSAAVKHLIWLSAFCVLLAAPVLTALLPSRAIPLVRADRPATVSTTLPDASTNQLAATPAGGRIAEEIPAGGGIVGAVPAPVSRIDWSRIGTAAVALWLLGAAIVALQSLYALAAVGRLRRRSMPLRGNEIDRGRLARQLGVTRPWELRVCAGPKAPAAMTWGVMNPVVMIPKESASWTTERLEAVLLHELAHVRRLDSVSQLIAVLACIVYWFNPAVWLCARAMRAEAEIAADDTVLGMGVKPSDYARELVRIAADLGTRRQPYSTIGVPVMKKSKIESRVQAILDPSTRRRRGISTVQILTTVAVAAAVVIPVSMLRASLVPVEPHTVVLTQQNGQDEDLKAKKEQERARLEALEAKELAEKAAHFEEQDKKAAEAAYREALIQKKNAEANAKVAAGQKVSAERLKVMKLEKAARMKQMEALYKQDRAAKAQGSAIAQLQAKMAALKAQNAAQQAALQTAQQQLKEALRRLDEAKSSSRASSREEDKKALEALRASSHADSQEILELARQRMKQAKLELDAAKAAAERARKLYEQGTLSKDEMDKAMEVSRLAEVKWALIAHKR